PAARARMVGVQVFRLPGPAHSHRPVFVRRGRARVARTARLGLRAARAAMARPALRENAMRHAMMLTAVLALLLAGCASYDGSGLVPGQATGHATQPAQWH